MGIACPLPRGGLYALDRTMPRRPGTIGTNLFMLVILKRPQFNIFVCEDGSVCFYTMCLCLFRRRPPSHSATPVRESSPTPTPPTIWSTLVSSTQAVPSSSTHSSWTSFKKESSRESACCNSCPKAFPYGREICGLRSMVGFDRTISCSSKSPVVL
jgi:hypothetical protein